MPVTWGLVVCAVICAVSGVACAKVLFGVVRQGVCPGVSGPLAAGVAAAVAGPVVAAVTADPIPALSLGYGAQAAFLVPAVLLLPSVAGTNSARVRRVFDGVIVAAGIFFATWTLLIEPLHRDRLGGEVPFVFTAECLAVAVPVLLILLSGGIVTAAALRAARPRAAPGGAAAGVCLTGVGGIMAITAAGRGDEARWAWLLAGAGLVTAAGHLLLVLSVRQARSQPIRPAMLAYGQGLFVAPVWLAFGATVVRLAFFGTPDKVSVGAGAFFFAALAVQQWLAGRSMRRAAERLAESEAHFKNLAFTDALTGLGNRRQLLKTLYEAAVGGPPCVLLAIDLDGFKNVNDLRGHDVGDALLAEVANRLRGDLHAGDLAVRMGGDEFAVLMWATPAVAAIAAERLRDLLDRPYEVGGGPGDAVGPVHVTASIGVAGCATADNVPALLRNADLALRFAKQEGKDRIERYDEAYDRWVRRRNELADALRGAAGRGELHVVYQPVMALAESRVAGVEALLRWHHPVLGQVPPDEFIPVAEEAGLIGELGAFVLDEAARRLSGWLAGGHDVWLSVNVSVHELHLPEYAERVAETLRAHALPRNRLVLEVTEHAVAIDLPKVVGLLAALRSAGVRVALDDFGAGYSSLGQLRQLPADILKIDRSFLSGSPEQSPAMGPIVDLVARLGHRLGLDVVAEGVTEEAQRQLLQLTGCRYGQGMLFGGPVPPEEVELRFDPPDTLSQMLGSPNASPNFGIF